MGFASHGKNVRVSRFAQFYGTDSISLGSNCRIDDFSGKFLIGPTLLAGYVNVVKSAVDFLQLLADWFWVKCFRQLINGRRWRCRSNDSGEKRPQSMGNLCW